MGDVTKASLWADADVYVGDLTATNPADAATAFSNDWDLVGLLDGDEGFEESRDEDTDDFYAWGGILVRSSRKNFKLTRKFVALETNDTVRSLVYPGSTATSIVIPRTVRKKIAFETREGNRVRRLISALYCEVAEIGDIKEGESDLTKYEITVTIFPNAQRELFIVQEDLDVTTP